MILLSSIHALWTTIYSCLSNLVIKMPQRRDSRAGGEWRCSSRRCGRSVGRARGAALNGQVVRYAALASRARHTRLCMPFSLCTLFFALKECIWCFPSSASLHPPHFVILYRNLWYVNNPCTLNTECTVRRREGNRRPLQRRFAPFLFYSL